MAWKQYDFIVDKCDVCGTGSEKPGRYINFSEDEKETLEILCLDCAKEEGIN